MTFVPVSLAGAKKSHWTYHSDSVTVSPAGEGVRCDIQVGNTRSGYGGVTFPVSPFKALRLEMAFANPSDVLSIFVDGYDAKGRCLRWAWEATGSRKPAAGVGTTYVLVPGKASGYFASVTPSDASQLRGLDVFVLANRSAKTSFTLSKVEIAK